MVNKEAYQKLKAELQSRKVELIAVSKGKPAEAIKELYDLGQRDFGENYVQELEEKRIELPVDIRWHFIGHLQSKKAKTIAPYVQLIQSVDSLKLLYEIEEHGKKNDRVIDCLLQVHIADEQSKFGLNERDLEKLTEQFIKDKGHLKNARIVGLMGIATLTNDKAKIRSEFSSLKKLFDVHVPQFFEPGHHSAGPVLSMGMSADYELAIEEGTTMVRIGSLIFGER